MPMETVKLHMGPDWKSVYGVDEVDYHIDFVTREQWCRLHDGTLATTEKFGPTTRTDMSEDERAKRIEFASLAIAAMGRYQDRLRAGQEYAKKHGIKQADWVERAERIADGDSVAADGPTADGPVIAAIASVAERRGWERSDQGYAYESLGRGDKACWFIADDELGPSAIMACGPRADGVETVTRFAYTAEDGTDSAIDRRMFLPYPDDAQDDAAITKYVTDQYDALMESAERTASAMTVARKRIKEIKNEADANTGDPTDAS